MNGTNEPDLDEVLANLIWLQRTREQRLADARNLGSAHLRHHHSD
ncbi:hypothetical protein ACWCQM_04470 [Streptomyces sp. NPDC002125]